MYEFDFLQNVCACEWKQIKSVFPYIEPFFLVFPSEQKCRVNSHKKRIDKKVSTRPNHNLPSMD